MFSSIAWIKFLQPCTKKKILKRGAFTYWHSWSQQCKCIVITLHWHYMFWKLTKNTKPTRTTLTGLSPEGVGLWEVGDCWLRFAKWHPVQGHPSTDPANKSWQLASIHLTADLTRPYRPNCGVGSHEFPEQKPVCMAALWKKTQGLGWLQLFFWYVIILAKTESQSTKCAIM